MVDIPLMVTEGPLRFHIGEIEPGECGRDCKTFVQGWLDWGRIRCRFPLAMLECVEDYPAGLRASARRMVRKANSLYTYEPFVYNDYLVEIDRINQSKPVRQGIPMKGPYAVPAEKTTPLDLCATHKDIWYGGFDARGRLMGYCRFCKLNRYGQPNSLIAHADTKGLINGMVAHLVKNADVDWINYLYIESQTPGLTAFKVSLGFVSLPVELML